MALRARKDFNFGENSYKKGDEVFAIPGTAFFNWLNSPNNKAVEDDSKIEVKTVKGKEVIDGSIT